MKKIYCANGNKRFAEIAIESGFLYGAQVPGKVYYNTFFLDQDWKNPQRGSYIEKVKERLPYMATVIDIETEETKRLALEWAEEIAGYVNKIVIIPKIKYLPPETIGGKDVVIGYSVPTRYGGTPVPFDFFSERKCHLLGGSPHKQMEIFMKYPDSVYSIDGNYHQKMAISYNLVWELGKKRAYGMWTKLRDYIGEECEDDCPYVAFDYSCKNIITNWRELERKYL